MRSPAFVFALAFSAACGRTPTTPTTGTSSQHQQPPQPPLFNLTGDYQLTLTPSSKCATVVDNVTGNPTPFPTVSYDLVKLTQQDSRLSLRVQDNSGTAFATVSGSLVGDRFSFSTPGPLGPITCDESFAAWISANELFGMCGTGDATVQDPQLISGTFSGGIEYLRQREDGSNQVYLPECQAKDHRFSLSRTLANTGTSTKH